MHIDPSLLGLIGLVWTAFWGIAGWFANDWFSRRKDRDSRKIHLAQRVETWRERVNSRCEVNESAIEFREQIDSFIGEARIVQRDMWFWMRQDFAILCENVRHFGQQITTTENDGKDQIGRAKFVSVLDDLVTFLYRHPLSVGVMKFVEQ